MGIVAIGNDLVSISRVNRTWLKFGERFLKRFLHPHEMYASLFFFFLFFSSPSPLSSQSISFSLSMLASHSLLYRAEFNRRKLTSVPRSNEYLASVYVL